VSSQNSDVKCQALTENQKEYENGSTNLLAFLLRNNKHTSSLYKWLWDYQHKNRALDDLISLKKTEAIQLT